VLSTHILPEVAQTCQKVVIINKGKVVAVDTPDALSERLRGGQALFVIAEGPAADIQRSLQSIVGVTRVAVTETRDAATTFEVDSDKGRDIRADVASAVVRGGWSLLELRPSRVSLEDVFLKLMTEERDPNAPDAPVAAGASAEAPNA
jgi:ABC-2 type transport system ATP-binding protein